MTRKGKKPTKRKSKGSRLSQRRRRTNVQASRRNPLSQSIGNGIRTLVSYLPGNKILSPIADFALKAIGLAATIDTDGLSIRATVANTMAVGKILLTVASFMEGQAFASTKALHTVSTSFKRFRVEWLRISARATNPAAKRAGEWILACVPLFNQEEENIFTTSAVPPLSELEMMPFMQKGTFDQQLSISFRPDPHDGRLYSYMRAGDGVIGLFIQYQRFNRSGDKYGEFTAEDVAFDIVLNARMSARYPNLTGGEDQQNVVSTKILDCLGGVSHIIDCDGARYYVNGASQESGSYSEVRGTVSQTVEPASMAI